MKKNSKVAEIEQLGSAVLRLQAEEVEQIHSSRIQAVIEQMHLTLSSTQGVGLAAPQIAQSLRIVLIASKPSVRYPSAPTMQPLIMINPSFKYKSKAIKKDWEGCLSIPGIRALVPRYQKIEIDYSDEQGEKQKLIAEDFVARIFQHEYDHLNGLVYLDRVEDNKDIISEAEFQKLKWL